jgi:hypothetical protein
MTSATSSPLEVTASNVNCGIHSLLGNASQAGLALRDETIRRRQVNAGNGHIVIDRIFSHRLPVSTGASDCRSLGEQ